MEPVMSAAQAPMEALQSLNPTEMLSEPMQALQSPMSAIAGMFGAFGQGGGASMAANAAAAEMVPQATSVSAVEARGRRRGRSRRRRVCAQQRRRNDLIHTTVEQFRSENTGGGAVSYARSSIARAGGAESIPVGGQMGPMGMMRSADAKNKDESAQTARVSLPPRTA